MDSERKIKKMDAITTRNVLMEYETVLRDNSSKKLSNNFFTYGDEQNEELAIEIMKYAFEKILEWTPTDIINKLNYEVLRDMKLTIPYAKLRYPRELKKKSEYFYVAKILYPDKVHGYTPRDIILHMYRMILSSKDGKFPKEYFIEADGEIRARVCLQFVLANLEIFESQEKLYEFFADEKQAMEFLKKHHLNGAKNLLFDSCLEYMHMSLPELQKNELLFCYHKFMQNNKNVLKMEQDGTSI